MDARNSDAKALAKAVEHAVDKLGPLATMRLLNEQLDAVRREAKSGEFPRALYGKDGETRTVESKAEEDDLGFAWSRTPQPSHRAASSSGAVAATQERLSAEVAVRRAQAAENPADSSVASRPVAGDTIITSSATIERPPAGDVSERPKKGA